MEEPFNYDKFIGNKKIIYEFKKWWEEYQKTKKEYIVIFTGQTGIGKSLLVNLFSKLNDVTLNDFSYFENKSLNKYKEDLKKVYSFQTILEIMYGKQVAILIDDIDSYVNDKKNINTIVKIILNGKINKLTFITCKSNIDKFFGKNKNVKLFNLKKPSFNDIENYIFDIGTKNKFLINNDGLKYIYIISNGDIRLINQLLKNLLSYIPNKKTKLKIDFDKYLTIKEEDIKILLSSKDIDYQLYDLIQKILFEKNSVEENINYILNDLHFLPSILYDNLQSLFKKKKNGLKIYYETLNNLVLAEYINNKTFENQNSLTYEYYGFINSCYVNHFIAPCEPIKIQYSVLMNKLLKISNSSKFKSELILKLPKEIKINILPLLIEIYNYMDKKNHKIINLTEYFESINIDYNKLVKYY